MAPPLKIIPFADRSTLGTAAAAVIPHLRDSGESPLEQYRELLRHQRSFWKWAEDRHKYADEVVAELNQCLRATGRSARRGPKEATSRKYQWYIHQLVLLDAINGFETFYKRTLASLANEIVDYLDPESIGFQAPIKSLLFHGPTISIGDVMFESRLFHDLENVDEATKALVGKPRYQPKNKQGAMFQKVLRIQCIFQIRHTISHNAGYVTADDCRKFRSYGFTVASGQIIDPTQDFLGQVVIDFLRKEAQDFTGWLAQATALYLASVVQKQGIAIPTGKRSSLEQLLGTVPEWSHVTWS